MTQTTATATATATTATTTTAPKPHNCLMNFELPRDLRRDFHIECMKRDVTASKALRELILHQLSQWTEFEHEQRQWSK